MVFLRRCGVLIAACVLAGACGGSNFNGISAGDDGGSSEGGGGDGSAGGADALLDVGSGGDDASTTDATGDAVADVTSDGAGDVQSATDGPAPLCPDVAGAYAITLVDAQGCGDLNPLAKQCIQQTGCAVVFQSSASGGAKPAINGDPMLQQDGSFSGGALKEGTVNRTGCTGTWDQGLSTMTVDCGGTGSSQACVASLRRVGDTCQ
jgi:hypothetical protein